MEEKHLAGLTLIRPHPYFFYGIILTKLLMALNVNIVWDGNTMKARAIILIDLEFPSFREAGLFQDKMDTALDMLIKDNSHVVTTQMDLKERRGDHAPDIKKMKFRNN